MLIFNFILYTKNLYKLNKPLPVIFFQFQAPQLHPRHLNLVLPNPPSKTASHPPFKTAPKVQPKAQPELLPNHPANLPPNLMQTK